MMYGSNRRPFPHPLYHFYCGTVVLWYCGIVVLWYCGIVVGVSSRFSYEAPHQKTKGPTLRMKVS